MRKTGFRLFGFFPRCERILQGQYKLNRSRFPAGFMGQHIERQTWSILGFVVSSALLCATYGRKLRGKSLTDKSLDNQDFKLY